MSDRPRFTLQLTLHDEQGFQRPLHWAIGVDDELRISTRAVDEMKMNSELGVSTMTIDDVVTLMRVKEFRRKMFQAAAIRLAGQMANAMEDAEGWHGTDRIEPARKQLGWTASD